MDVVDLIRSLKAIFHYSRFARAGGATNFHRVKNQSRGHAKKVECSSTLTRVREQTSGQKLRRLDNYRECWKKFALARAVKTAAVENGLSAYETKNSLLWLWFDQKELLRWQYNIFYSFFISIVIYEIWRLVWHANYTTSDITLHNDCQSISYIVETLDEYSIRLI